MHIRERSRSGYKSLARLSQAQGLPEVAAGKKAGEWERQRSGGYRQRGRN